MNGGSVEAVVVCIPSAVNVGLSAVMNGGSVEARQPPPSATLYHQLSAVMNGGSVEASGVISSGDLIPNDYPP